MKRGHRILRLVHAQRQHRWERAVSRERYRPLQEFASFTKALGDLRVDGHLDPGMTHAGTVALIGAVMAVMVAEMGPGGRSEAVAEALSDAAFAGRSRVGGRLHLAGSDRLVVDGCSALAWSALIDRMFRAVGEVMRRRAVLDHRVRPCWPESYRRRAAEPGEADRADASGGEAAEGRAAPVSVSERCD